MFSACSSDRSNNPDSTEKSSNSQSQSSEKSSESKDSSASKNSSDSKDSNVSEDPNDSEDYIFTSESDYIVDSTWDSYNRENVQTVQFGIYLWMTENASRDEFTTNNTCYEEEEDNCKKYGRLYMVTYADDACPQGFHIPTISDWKALDSFRKQTSARDSLIGLTYGGSCATDRQNELICSGINKSGNYLTSENKTFVIKNGEKKISFGTLNRYDYYSLRCLTYTYIVKTTKDLPTCDTTTQDFLENFYVVEERSNYHCTGSRWVDDFSDDCPRTSKDMRFTYNDTMFICKGGYWQEASIYDSKNFCTEDLEGRLLVFNGERYACENNEWRKFNDIENALGYCNSKKFLKIDTLVKKSSKVGYICDSTGWRKAVMTDYIGVCDSAKQYKTAKFDSTRYVCHRYNTDQFDWRPMSKLEQELGVCTPKRYKAIDTTKGNDHYVCDSTGWRSAQIADYVGDCTQKREEEEVFLHNKYYVCLNNTWMYLSGLEADLGLCSKKNLGKYANNASTGEDYRCDSTGWKKATFEEMVGKCDMKTMGKEGRYNSVDYYCTGADWRTSSSDSTKKHCLLKDIGTKDSILVSGSYRYFLCDSNGWKRITDRDKRLGYCTTKNDSTFKTYKDTSFVCLNENWTPVSAKTFTLGFCTQDLEGTTKIYDKTTYVCRKKSWGLLTKLETELGVCSVKNEGEVKDDPNSPYYAYVCENNNWSYMDIAIAHLGKCTPEIKDSVGIIGDVGYKCENHTWKVMDIGDVQDCDTAQWGRIINYRGVQYVCRDLIWTLRTELDSILGPCSLKIVDSTVAKSGKYYKCAHETYCASHWEQISEVEYKFGKCKADIFTFYNKMLEPDRWYKCNHNTWTSLESDPKAAFGTCGTSETDGLTKSLFGSTYICDTSLYKDGWTQAMPMDTIAGLCTHQKALKAVSFITDSIAYLCKEVTDKTSEVYEIRSYYWQPTNYPTALGNCTSSRVGEKLFNGVNTSVCTDNGWTAADTNTFTDTRDGHKYGYVTINKKSWMTTNLMYNSGDSVWVTSKADSNGILYARSRINSVCPSGWKAATTKDWNDLLAYVSAKDTTYKNITRSRYYGVRMTSGVQQIYYLQNGQDPMQTSFSCRDPMIWSNDSNMYYPISLDGKSTTSCNFYNNTKGGDGQYQDINTIGLPVRCIKE